MSQSSMTALLATMGTNLDNSNEINLIQAFPKGFLFDYGPGKMILFEKETGLKYKKRNVFRLDEQKPDSMIIEEATTQVVEEENLTKINSFSISPTQDYLVVTCALPQLFFVYMWGPDINRYILQYIQCDKNFCDIFFSLLCCFINWNSWNG